MNVDRSALTALVLFGLLGLGFAVIGVGDGRPPGPSPKKEPEFEGLETLPPPRTVQASSRALYVSVAAPGLSVEEIEMTVATPLEQGLMPLEGRVDILTRIEPGRCRLTVNLAANQDVNQARTHLLELINGLVAQLPAGVAPPLVEVQNPDALPELWIVARDDGTRTLSHITNFLRSELHRTLLAIPGISGVEMRGDVREQLRVYISLEKLRARELTIEDVVAAVSKAKIANPGGVQKLESVVVTQRNGAPIFLRDVASIAETAESLGFARVDGKRNVLTGVRIAEGADTLNVANAIRDALQKINARNPPGQSLEIVADATRGNAEDLLVEIQLPRGTSPEVSEEAVSRIEQAVRDRLPRAETGEIVTLGPKKGMGHQRVVLLFSLPADRQKSTDEIQKQMHDAISKLPGQYARIISLRSRSLPRSIELPVGIRLGGNELDQLRLWSAEVLTRMREEPQGLIDADSSVSVLTPEMRMTIDRDKAALVGITAREIATVLETATDSFLVNSEGGPIAITLGEKRGRADDLALVPIRNNDGKQVLLRDVARLEQVQSLATLERINGQRCVKITANPASGTAIAQAQANLRKIAEEARAKLKLPPSFKILDE